MKTIYSLREFREEVLKIAILVNEDYVTVGVEMEYDQTFEFRCYVNNYGAHTGRTMEESIAKLRKKTGQSIPQEIDVVIEIPELQTENQ